MGINPILVIADPIRIDAINIDTRVEALPYKKNFTVCSFPAACSTDFSLCPKFWTSLFRNDQCARHVFVAAATEDVASERELTSLSRRKTDAHHGTRFHLAANTKVRQTESVSDVL